MVGLSGSSVVITRVLTKTPYVGGVHATSKLAEPPGGTEAAGWLGPLGPSICGAPHTGLGLAQPALTFRFCWAEAGLLTIRLVCSGWPGGADGWLRGPGWLLMMACWLRPTPVQRNW